MKQTPSQNSSADAYHRLLAAMYAGLGAATGFLFFFAASNFLAHWFDQTFAVAISTLVIGLFIEPLIERVTSPLHRGEARRANEPGTWTFRAWAFGVLAVTALSHHLVDEIVTQNPWGAGGLVATALLLPGGITYFWILGARRRPSSAAAYGLMGGIILAGLFFFLVFVLANGKAVIVGASGQASFVPMPFGHAELTVIVNAMPWILCGFFGGLAVDHHWGQRPAVGVPATLVAVIVLLEIAAKIFDHGIPFSLIAMDVSRVTGWAVGLWVYIPTDAMLANRPISDDVK